jgi:hypothetical protein
MAEWLKAHAWKVCSGETHSRVRIPLSPPPRRRHHSDARSKELYAASTARIVDDKSIVMKSPSDQIDTNKSLTMTTSSPLRAR